MKKVLMIPDWRFQNPYLDLLAKALNDTEVSFSDFPSGIFPLNKIASKYPQMQIIHLHWINDLIAPAIWASSDYKNFIRRTLIAVDLLLVRARQRRIVWTIHNYVTHESDNPPSELKVRSTVARFVSHVIVHSPGALHRVREGYGLRGLENDRVSVIRHGNYDGYYPLNVDAVDSLRKRFDLQNGQTVLLFLGAVRRYKGVERLLRTFIKCERTNLRLVIAGKPNPVEYQVELSDIAQSDPRIVFEYEFIPESQISAYYAVADVVVIPFERTLTSGSAVLAMTQGKAIILPEHARELDLVDDSGAIYFSDEDDLKKIFDDLKPDLLHRMGEINRNISKGYAWPLIAKQTTQAYGDEPMVDLRSAY